jgi:transposase-like protein
MTALNAAHFKDEVAAYAFVEARVWPQGRICPHCGVVENSGALKGKSTRIGTYKCYSCRKPFTVKVGTIFEKSHIPMHIWLQAMFLLCSSKKGMSANQLHRILGVTLKSAWFMAHRIRKAMEDGSFGPLGGEGKIVEADETYMRKSPKTRRKPGQPRPVALLSFAERGGAVRSVPLRFDPTRYEIVPHIKAGIDPASTLHTDGAQHYKFLAPAFVAGQESVDHNKAYVRKTQAGVKVHTNTLEGYFSIFKRGMTGTYQHCQEKHLGRYLSEFDFRYTNRVAAGIDDQGRALLALDGVKGKRLMYRELTQ